MPSEARDVLDASGDSKPGEDAANSETREVLGVNAELPRLSDAMRSVAHARICFVIDEFEVSCRVGPLSMGSCCLAAATLILKRWGVLVRDAGPQLSREAARLSREAARLSREAARLARCEEALERMRPGELGRVDTADIRE